jgi:hypothetical protein
MTRGSENGLSVIETLVMLAATMLAVSLLLPVVSRGVATDFGRAEGSLSKGAQERGEATYRALLGRAAPAPTDPASSSSIAGNRDSVEFSAFVEGPTACTSESGWVRVRLWIERDLQGGVLRCRSAGREEILARWTGGSAGFSYREGVSAWREAVGGERGRTRLVTVPSALTMNGGGDLHPVIVRFEASGADGRRMIWVETAPAPTAGPEPYLAREEDGGGDLDR